MTSPWPLVKLGDVCKVVNGGTPDTKKPEYWGSEHAWVTPAEMGKRFTPLISETKRKLTDLGLASCTATLLPQESVILSSRAPIGHLVINQVPMSTNQGCKGIVPSNQITTWFLYYQLLFRKEELNSLGTGTTFKEISGSTLKNVQIVLPPLDEQKRIVTKLDDALSVVEKLKVNTAQAKSELDALWQSANTQSFSGEWPTVKLGEVCTLLTGGTPSKKNQDFYAGGLIPWLVSGDIHSGEIWDCAGRITDLGLKESNARWLPEDSVMIALNGQGKTRGTVALLRIKATCNQSLVAIVPNEKKDLSAKFLYFNLKGRYQELRNMTSDDNNDRRGLNMPILRKIYLPFPPLDEQKRIVAKLDEIKSELDRQREILVSKELETERLRSSILTAAFSGEL